MNPSNIIQVRNILCKVIYDFDAKDKQEMSVRAGDVVEVVKRYKDGWSWCFLKSRPTETVPIEESYGMIPTAYLNEIEESPEASSSNEGVNLNSSQLVSDSKKHNVDMNNSFIISKNGNAEPMKQKTQTTIFQDEDFSQVVTEQSDNLSVTSYRTDCTDMSIGGERRSRKKEILAKLGSFFRKSKKMENSETPKTPRIVIKHESFRTTSSIVEERTEKIEKVPKVSNGLHQMLPFELLNDVKKKVTKTETTKRESISFNLFSRQKKNSRKHLLNHQQTVNDQMLFIAEKIKQFHRKKAMQRYLKTDLRFKKAKKRLELIKETIDTERTYVSLLKAFIDTFYNPIVNDTGHGKGILKKEVFQTLFSNIEQIYKINNTLLHDWEYEYNTNYPFVNIGKAFSLISPFLKAYTIYINNFDKAQETFEKLREKDKKFKEYLTECYKNKSVKGTLLGGFLILPVQRIPRYKLLIQEMLKNTPTNHQEYELLQKCAKEIEIIAAFVNDEKRNVEQNQTVFEVQHLVQKQYPTFVQPNRKFIKRGSMKIKMTIHRIEEHLENKRVLSATSSKHSSVSSNQDPNLMTSCLMTCREAKFDVYLFTDVLVLIEMEKNKSVSITDEKVHFVFLQFVDCRDFVRISHNGRSRDFIESPDSLLSNHNSKRSSLQWDDNIFKRIEHEDFSFVIEALFKGVKTEYSFMTSNIDEKKVWMKSIRDCLEGLNRGNFSKGIEQDIYLLGKERISLNKIAKCKLEEHQSLEKGCLLKVSYLTQLEQHLAKKKQQLAKLQKEIEIYNLDRDQVMLESKTLQEKKIKIREDLKFYYLSIQERDQTMMKLLNEEQSFKLIFDDVPTVDSETVYKM